MAQQSTTDYKQFQFLIDNRQTARNHINKLKDAISKKPDILEAQPILVNENLEIIDGQHRFWAASELGLPVHYNVVPGLDIQTARQLNILQRRWTVDDFAFSYAKAGNENYKLFNELRRAYPSLSASVLQMVMNGGETNNMSGDFRSGNFVAKLEEDDIRDILEKLQHIREVTGLEVPVSKSFAAAFLTSLKNEDFDYSDFISNLEKKPDLFHRTSTVRDALRLIEDVFNYRKSTNLIRLY